MIRVFNIVFYRVGVIANPDIHNFDELFISGVDFKNHKELANQVAEILNLGDIYQYSTSTNTTKLNFQTIKDEIIYQVKADIELD